jgi:Glycosyltransferase (GlcNAc)
VLSLSSFFYASPCRYDVYTPTKNVVFHDYGEQLNGHGNMEWFKHRLDRFRLKSIERVKIALKMTQESVSDTVVANLGLYSVGKRRTIQQLQAFTGIDLINQKGNNGNIDKCAQLEWVPYDPSISPLDNMYDKPDNLDPQPEFPLRTNFVFYEQYEDDYIPPAADGGKATGRELDGFAQSASDQSVESNSPPMSLMFVLWLFGLIVACALTRGSKKVNGRSDVRVKPRRKTDTDKDI